MDIPQEVNRLHNPAERGACFGKTVYRRTVRQALNDHMRRGRASLQRGSHSHQLIPLFANQVNLVVLKAGKGYGAASLPCGGPIVGDLPTWQLLRGVTCDHDDHECARLH
jgi:hypothetical protein